MKRFIIEVVCANASTLQEALDFASACIGEDPTRYNQMQVDETDEQLSDPDYIKSSITRNE
ncbi:hypothetical protein [Xanthomonas phage XAJ2]|uniref:Uncharacterized protein n=1 Tax=Xanthomonas phage XAJ2 TaxID=1775249 RepID=A0A1I9L2H4_9CAUD|nr:hypothetical protein [Xanthomonas phage XAJ2]